MNRRYFDLEIGETTIQIYFRKPRQRQQFEIDKEYKKAMSQSLREGLMTEIEARRIYAERGVWTKDDEDKINELSNQIAQAEIILGRYDGTEDSDTRLKNLELASEASALRSELVEKIFEKNSLFTHTAEGLANDQKTHLFIRLCCCKKSDSNGVLMFNKDEEYQNFLEEHPESASNLLTYAYADAYGAPLDVTENWGELSYLDKAAEVDKQRDDENKAYPQPRHQFGI